MQLKAAAAAALGSPQPGPAPRARALLAAALALPALQPAAAQPVADDDTTVSLKVLDYHDRQPGAQRVRVRAPALALQAPLVAGRWHLGATLISDAISGASPAFHTRALTPLVDERNAGDVALTRSFDDSALTIGASYSKESDYIGRGVSLRWAVASADRNTSWTLAASSGRDSINPVNRIVFGERKRRSEWLLGVTQVLTPRDVVQVNIGHQRADGYLSDPYKFYDERPRQRRQHTLTLRWNHHLDALDASLRISWRGTRDSWSIGSHTIGVEWVQPLPAGFTLTPSLRLYSQRAAGFYVDAVESELPFPPNPPDGARFYSLDQRLAAFGARTLGVKITKAFSGGWSAELKLERYVQRSAWHWGGSGSPHLAELSARSVLAGVSRTF